MGENLFISFLNPRTLIHWIGVGQQLQQQPGKCQKNGCSFSSIFSEWTPDKLLPVALLWWAWFECGTCSNIIKTCWKSSSQVLTATQYNMSIWWLWSTQLHRGMSSDARIAWKVKKNHCWLFTHLCLFFLQNRLLTNCYYMVLCCDGPLIMSI